MNIKTFLKATLAVPLFWFAVVALMTGGDCLHGLMGW